MNKDEPTGLTSDYLLELKDLSAKDHPLVFAMKPVDREELMESYFEVYQEVPYHWDDLEQMAEDVEKYGIAQLKYWESKDASLLTYGR